MDRKTTTRWAPTPKPDDVTGTLLRLLFGDEPQDRAPLRPLRRRAEAS